MSEHKLPKGRRLIDGLTKLGIALGYHVEREFPVLSGTRGDDPAVDVAWFGHKRHPFPLMIFEVESRAGNTIANNPLKVFAQDSKQFEKPLFYFQIIADGPATSARIPLLEKQFGTFNYRLFRLGSDEGTDLLKAVIGQHSRVRKTIDYCALYEAISLPEWKDVVIPTEVMEAAYELRLSRSKRLAAYIQLACTHADIRTLMLKVINSERTANWPSRASSYIGCHWGPAILCAWMIGQADNDVDAGIWDQHLREWNDNTCGYLPMICSEIYLSNEYADFMLSLGGPFVACLTGTARCRGESIPRFLKVLVESLIQIEHGDEGLQLAVWVCHIAARLHRADEYEVGRAYIERSGGLPLDKILTPPSHFSLEDGGRDEHFGGEPSTSLAMAEFYTLANQLHGKVDHDVSQIAFTVLDYNEYVLEWAPDVLAALWADG